MSAGKLPEGWVSTSIENISVKCSQRVPAENEEFIYVDIGSINRELKLLKPLNIFLVKMLQVEQERLLRQEMGDAANLLI
ncbi:hypothetical protein [Escherichia coli]|uniref:hypothetical protein n=1 Tax=Escherichia coli TaxID=562 RepID=UPI00163ACD28|nr:hypothetical protein [Escherichia coli]MBN4727620.1 hypothetical protein [Escherichia coli]MBN4733490.1 hypothetical protein [Escherichia coli]MCX9429349.1 hypothetical protein [Escherichia coli]MCX9436090.1 hypothetical protein [Escherichia coli]MDD8159988.1 hypothetical protein [Escherichia coli]